MLSQLSSSRKLGKQFGKADKLKVPVVAVAGESERAAGQVQLKYLPTGEQLAVSIDAAALQVRTWLDQSGTS